MGKDGPRFCQRQFSRFRAETVNHGVIGKHLVDAGYTAVIPNLLEPSPNQSLVLK